jgi:TPR repeat protein
MSFLGAMFKIVNELNAFSLRDTREKALNGDVREQFLLGTAYLDGQGVDKNDWEAAYWFQRAADQGHAKAMTSLGIMHCLGRGVPKDAIEGVKWLTIAARRGHAPAKKSLETAKLKLSPEDLATAEQYADEYIRNWDLEIATQEAEEKGLPPPPGAKSSISADDHYSETLSPGSYSPDSHPDEYHSDDHSAGEHHAGEDPAPSKS